MLKYFSKILRENFGYTSFLFMTSCNSVQQKQIIDLTGPDDTVYEPKKVLSERDRMMLDSKIPLSCLPDEVLALPNSPSCSEDEDMPQN